MAWTFCLGIEIGMAAVRRKEGQDMVLGKLLASAGSAYGIDDDCEHDVGLMYP